MRFYLVRHTKPVVKNGICYGQSDIDLSSSFTQEKLAVLKKLSRINYDSVYSSPSKRCASLAESIDLKGSAIVFDDRLMEMNFGSWEMKKWADIENSQYAKRWFADFINLPTPEGESYIDLLARVRQFIMDIQAINDNVKLLIVCHKGVIGAFSTIINNTDPLKAFDLKIDFGDILELELKRKL